MPADFYALLNGDDTTAEEQAQALAAALRKQQEVGIISMLANSKSLKQPGEMIFRDAQLKRGGARDVLQERAALGERQRATEEQGLRNAILAERAREQMAETQRHNRAVEAYQQAQARAAQTTAQNRPPPYQMTSDAEGNQYFVDPRNPKAPGIPVTGPDGKPVMKAGKPLTETQGQAAMFLEQAQRGLAGAQGMGKKILPAEGLAGIPESLAWKARAAGFPQASSSDMQARQSILLSIAEPIVRAESGAAVPDSEVRRLALRYVPMPGESRQEQHRKLSSLIGAIGAVSQKLPPAKAAEFAPFQQQIATWAAELGGQTPTPPGAPQAAQPKRRIRIDANGNLIP